MGTAGNKYLWDEAGTGQSRGKLFLNRKKFLRGQEKVLTK
jgi:hypothetical protein